MKDLDYRRFVIKAVKCDWCCWYVRACMVVIGRGITSVVEADAATTSWVGGPCHG